MKITQIYTFIFVAFILNKCKYMKKSFVKINILIN